MLFSEQLSSFSEQLFGILRAQSGHAYRAGGAGFENLLTRASKTLSKTMNASPARAKRTLMETVFRPNQEQLPKIQL